jgi:hypothetical protein
LITCISASVGGNSLDDQLTIAEMNITTESVLRVSIRTTLRVSLIDGDETDIKTPNQEPVVTGSLPATGGAPSAASTVTTTTTSTEKKVLRVPTRRYSIDFSADTYGEDGPIIVYQSNTLFVTHYLDFNFILFFHIVAIFR